MSDRLKFRVWNPSMKRYMDGSDHQPFTYGSGKFFIHYDRAELELGRDITVEQCTGYKDSDGVLIYENDRWQRGGFIGVVKWWCGGWAFETAHDSKCVSFPDFYGNRATGKVIGSIHERAEPAEDQQ